MRYSGQPFEKGNNIFAWIELLYSFNLIKRLRCLEFVVYLQF